MLPSRRRAETSLTRSHTHEDDALDERLFYALRRVAQGFEVDSRRMAEAHGLTGPQLVCLRAVANLEPTTATDVSQSVHLSPSTIVGVFDRLEAKGLIERQRDSKDRRLVFVSATEAGRGAAAEAPHPLSDALRTLLGRRSKTEQQALLSAMDELARLLDEAEES